MRTIKQNIYTFGELSDSAKERAREWWRKCDDFAFEAECVIDDAKIIMGMLGFYNIEIWYKGFYSQGDGAGFDAKWSHEKGSIAAIKQYAPLDNTLHNIARNLLNVARATGYKMQADISCKRDFWQSVGNMFVDGRYYGNDAAEENLKDACQDLAQWVYSRLEKQYEFTQSDDYVDEAISANEYEFTEDGKLFN